MRYVVRYKAKNGTTVTDSVTPETLDTLKEMHSKKQIRLLGYYPDTENVFGFKINKKKRGMK